ncbi:cRISPR-associated endoribonuclease Cas2 1 [Eubacterium sp. CAG:786]|nr:cRISPR-associated endoribonuclease Cas2 1 [Eubacterium sp. CAG:786]
MSYRFMRVLVFFDLPVLTSDDRRAYRKFRKSMLKKGFIMLQESVYCRMALNKTMADQILDSIKRDKPEKGLVMSLLITEKQFERMEFITGEFVTDMIDTDERVVFL